MKGIIADKSKATIEEPMLDRYPNYIFLKEIKDYYDSSPVITSNDLKEAVEKSMAQINKRLPCGVELTAEIYSIHERIFLHVTEKPKSFFKHWIRIVAIWVLEKTR